jgi:hypothetical protein
MGKLEGLATTESKARQPRPNDGGRARRSDVLEPK